MAADQDVPQDKGKQPATSGVEGTGGEGSATVSEVEKKYYLSIIKKIVGEVAEEFKRIDDPFKAALDHLELDNSPDPKPPGDITICKPEKDDSDQMAVLQTINMEKWDIFKKKPGEKLSEPSKEEKEALLEKRKAYFKEIFNDRSFLVAKHKGEVVAFSSSTYPAADFNEAERSANLQGLQVYTAHRRKKIASTFNKEICDHARKIGCVAVVLKTAGFPDQLEFYKRLNYYPSSIERVTEVSGRETVEDYSEIRYRKPLDIDLRIVNAVVGFMYTTWTQQGTPISEFPTKAITDIFSRIRKTLEQLRQAQFVGEAPSEATMLKIIDHRLGLNATGPYEVRNVTNISEKTKLGRNGHSLGNISEKSISIDEVPLYHEDGGLPGTQYSVATIRQCIDAGMRYKTSDGIVFQTKGGATVKPDSDKLETSIRATFNVRRS